MGDETAEVEDALALEEAGSNADIVLIRGFSLRGVPGALGGARNSPKVVAREFSVLAFRRWAWETHAS